jgi:multicomponent K+:H+ antiporter subunit E
MMKQVLPHPILTLMLLALWLLLVNSVGAGQVLLGLLLAWLIPLFTARFWEAQVEIRRPFVLARFLGRVLADILIANIAVAALVVGPARNVRPGFIVMPLRLRGNVGVSLLANTISLTPGTLSAFLSADRTLLVIHALQADDPEDIIATIRKRYEQPLLEALE